MKSSQRRDRDFSATRLSYSRQRLDQSYSQTNISPSHRTHESKSLLCNNCFNRQTLTKKQKVKKLQQKEEDMNEMNTTWTFFDKPAQEKNRSVMKQEIRKVNEYNLNKIRENQIKKYNENNSVINNEEDRSFLGRSEKNRQINQYYRLQRRVELREDLEKQIALTKERRLQERKQNNEPPSGQLIQEKSRNNQNRQKLEEQYKKGLLLQIRQHKKKKEQEELARKALTQTQSELKFIREADEKRVRIEKIIKETKEQINEEYKRKKELEALQKQQEVKVKQNELRTRLEEEYNFREEIKKNQQIRRANIEHYLQDLRQQIQENKIHRREEFDKIKSRPQTSAIFGNPNKNVCSSQMEPCSCCSKNYPKQFLSPLEGPV